jgi:hypothetical protein
MKPIFNRCQRSSSSTEGTLTTLHFGWFAQFAAMYNPPSSQRVRELLRRQPKLPGLIADIDRTSYEAGKALDGVGVQPENCGHGS